MTWTTRPRSDLGPVSAIVEGTGPTILLIHGVGLCAESWGAQIGPLAARHRVVAVDMPGHGASAALAEPARLADFTDAIADAVEGPCVAVGHSFGAMIALDMAIRHPAKLRAVAALNAIHRRDAAAKTAVLARAASLDGLHAADPEATLTRWFGAAPCAARDACHRWLRGADPRGYRAAYRVFAAEDGPSDHDLAHLRVPALFVTGAQEPNSTPDMSRCMARLAPLGRAEIVAGAAHMAPMTHAAQVTARLLAFLDGLAP